MTVCRQALGRYVWPLYGTCTRPGWGVRDTFHRPRAFKHCYATCTTYNYGTWLDCLKQGEYPASKQNPRTPRTPTPTVVCQLTRVRSRRHTM